MPDIDDHWMMLASSLLAFPWRRRHREGGCAPFFLRSRMVRLVEQPTLEGEHDRLGAVSDLELLQDPRDVGFDRGVADEELVPDLGVGHASGQKAEDVYLLRGQRLNGGGGWSPVHAHEVPDDVLRDGR